MVNQQLVDYIKTQEAQGYAPQQLRDSLIQQGYNPNEIDEAIKTVGATPPSQKPQAQQPVPCVLAGSIPVSTSM